MNSGTPFHTKKAGSMSFELDTSDPKQAHIADRLRDEVILWIATVRPDGKPHLVPVWFLWHEGTILVFSKPNNQKVRNLRQNSAVVVSLDNTDDGDDVITFEGVAELFDDLGVTPEMPEYASKYTGELADMNQTPASMAQEYTQAIRITPTRRTNLM